jgi:hypothetical protein
MERDITSDNREQSSGAPALAGRSERDVVGQARQVQAEERTRNAVREPIVFQARGSSHRLSPSDLATMHDIGRFRTVATADLEKHRYSGNKGNARKDLRSLEEQGLVQIRTVRASARRPPLTVAVLTKRGHGVLTELRPRPEQAVYKGFVKPREVPHDAAIYRMFQAERARIERDGGAIRRVVLDYELKQRVYAPLATFRSHSPKATKADYARLQQEVAQQNGLKVIEGKIPLPDLRIEYETAGGEMARVDLELATHHYHGGAMAAKAQAGFRFYAVDGSAGRLTQVLQERDITVAILSL